MAQTEAQRRATTKWYNDPENKKKHNKWCLNNYHKRRTKKFEERMNKILEIGDDRERLLKFLVDNFNLKNTGE